jgi:hypothetical protein
MKLLVRFLSEIDIDAGIKSGLFCPIHQFSNSIAGEQESEKYFAKQNELIIDLESRMQKLYGERVFVSDNVWLAELLKIEIGADELNKGFPLAILDFLNHWRSTNCVNVAVYSGSLHDKGNSYLGRMLIGGKGITIEESLKELVKDCLGIVLP